MRWKQAALIAALTLAPFRPAKPQPDAAREAIPQTHTETLDGHAIDLPHDLPGRVAVLIVGFGRRSEDATTAWEKAVRTDLANAGAPGMAASPHGVGFLDLAMLAEVPGFVRPMVTHAIRGKVPDVLKPNFVVLTEDEDRWKRVAGYDAHDSDAAYVLLSDRAGRVRWSTHAPFNPARFAELAQKAHAFADETH